MPHKFVILISPDEYSKVIPELLVLEALGLPTWLLPEEIGLGQFIRPVDRKNMDMLVKDSFR